MLKKISSFFCALAILLLAACNTTTSSDANRIQPTSTIDSIVVGQEPSQPVGAYRLKVMDPITIQFKGLPEGTDILTDVVDEQGGITLAYIGRVNAAGLTTAELERAIYDAYVDGEIYKSTFSVMVTAQEKSFYVWGEVRSPGRYPLISGTTLLQAVASAGGYSPYANQKRIQLNRSGQSYFFNGKELESSPEDDPEVEADDVIRVHRSIL